MHPSCRTTVLGFLSCKRIIQLAAIPVKINVALQEQAIACVLHRNACPGEGGDEVLCQSWSGQNPGPAVRRLSESESESEYQNTKTFGPEDGRGGRIVLASVVLTFWLVFMTSTSAW